MGYKVPEPDREVIDDHIARITNTNQALVCRSGEHTGVIVHAFYNPFDEHEVYKLVGSGPMNTRYFDRDGAVASIAKDPGMEIRTVAPSELDDDKMRKRVQHYADAPNPLDRWRVFIEVPDDGRKKDKVHIVEEVDSDKVAKYRSTEYPNYEDLGTVREIIESDEDHHFDLKKSGYHSIPSNDLRVLLKQTAYGSARGLVDPDV